ncbi:hypothetical protein GALMADRAFT_81397 [Galerina marginata CBS 339.88]|uniref:Glutathione peroxidase n=1 Tax=Galerina marginata (strain CBS 339.88) TaxID=685588 RepID=A0A067S4Y9_GALM3|nr:hypothetical protein GALMADRAFT_81397 [Galerina marginata CBS 339.88]
MSDSEFYTLKADLPAGKVYDFETLKGKTVLVVNTASKCGLTPHFKGLQSLYEKYNDQGLVVLGFPSNQFGGQNPEDDEGTQEFCSVNYGVTFPLMTKSDVNGETTNKVFKWLKAQKEDAPIQWNFEKFLIDKNGSVFNRYGPMTTPEEVEVDIKTLL